MTLAPRLVGHVAIPVGPDGLAARQRADIEVAGLDQAGPSFELRIFLNDPDADAQTERSAASGYAGSIHVYGYGQPPARAGAQSGQPPTRAGAQSHSRPRIPMTRRVGATDAVRTAAAKGAEATVTLVAVAFQEGPAPDVDLGDVEVSVLVHE